jgi:hypothetical protein
MKSRTEILETVHDEILDKLVRNKIDGEFYSKRVIAPDLSAAEVQELKVKSINCAKLVDDFERILKTIEGMLLEEHGTES